METWLQALWCTKILWIIYEEFCSLFILNRVWLYSSLFSNDPLIGLLLNRFSVFFFSFYLIDAECVTPYWHCRFKDDLSFYMNNWQVVCFMLVCCRRSLCHCLLLGEKRLQCSRPPMLILLTWLSFSCTYNRSPFQHLFHCLSVYVSVTSIGIWVYWVFCPFLCAQQLMQC